jgi:hypothetical protein
MAYLNPFYSSRKKKKDNIASPSMKAIIPKIENVGVVKLSKDFKAPKAKLPKVQSLKALSKSSSKSDLIKTLEKNQPIEASTQTSEQKVEGLNRVLPALGYLGDAFSVGNALSTAIKESRLASQEQNAGWRAFWSAAIPYTTIAKTGINMLGNTLNAANVLITGNLSEDPIKSEPFTVEIAKSINYIVDGEVRAKVENAVKNGQSVSEADAQYVSDYGISDYGGFGVTSLIPATFKIVSGSEKIENVGDFFQVYAREQDAVTKLANEGTFGNIPVLSDILGFSAKIFVGADNFIVRSFTKDPLGFVADIYGGAKLGALSKSVTGTGTVAKLTRGTLRSFDEIPGVPYLTEFADLPSTSKYFSFSNATKIVDANKYLNDAIGITERTNEIVDDVALNTLNKESLKANFLSSASASKALDTNSLEVITKIIDDFKEPLTNRSTISLRTQISKALSIDDNVVKKIVSTQPQYIARAMKQVTGGRVSPKIEDLLKPNVLSEVKSSLMDGSLRISSSQYITDPGLDVLSNAIKQESLTADIAKLVEGTPVADGVIGKAKILSSNFKQRMFPQSVDLNAVPLRERLVTEIKDGSSQVFSASPQDIGVKAPVPESINNALDYEAGKMVNYKRIVGSDEFNMKFRTLQLAINNIPAESLLRNLIEDIAKKIDFTLTTADDITISAESIASQRARFANDFFNSSIENGVLSKEKAWNNLMYISGIQLNDGGRILSVIDYINKNKELYAGAENIVNLFNANKALFDYFKIQVGMNGADVSNFYGNYVPTIYNSPRVFEGDPTSPFLNFNASKAGVKLSTGIQDLAGLNLFERGNILYKLKDIVSAHAMNISASNQMFFIGRLTGIGNSYFGITELFERAFGLASDGFDTNLSAVINGASTTIETYINTAPIQVREIFVQELSAGVQSVVNDIVAKSGKIIELSDILKVSGDNTVSVDLTKIFENGERGVSNVSLSEAKKLVANMQNTLGSDPAFTESMKDIAKVDISEKMWELSNIKRMQDSTIDISKQTRDSFSIPLGVLENKASKTLVESVPFNDILTAIDNYFPGSENYFDTGNIDSASLSSIRNGVIVLPENILKTTEGNTSNIIDASFRGDFIGMLQNNTYGLMRYTEFLEKYAAKINKNIDILSQDATKLLHQSILTNGIKGTMKTELSAILSDIFDFNISASDLDSIINNNQSWVLNNELIGNVLLNNPEKFINGIDISQSSLMKSISENDVYSGMDLQSVIKSSNLDSVVASFYSDYIVKYSDRIKGFTESLQEYYRLANSEKLKTGLSGADKYKGELSRIVKLGKEIDDSYSKLVQEGVSITDAKRYFAAMSTSQDVGELAQYINTKTNVGLLDISGKKYLSKLVAEVDDYNNISVSFKNIEIQNIISDAIDELKSLDKPIIPSNSDIIKASLKIQKINDLAPENIQSLYEIANIDMKVLNQTSSLINEIKDVAGLKTKIKDVLINPGEDVVVSSVPYIDIDIVKGSISQLLEADYTAKNLNGIIDNQIIRSANERVLTKLVDDLDKFMTSVNVKIGELKSAKTLSDIENLGFSVKDGKIDFSQVSNRLFKQLSPLTGNYNEYSMRGVAEFNAKHKITLSEIASGNPDALSKDILSKYLQQSGKGVNTYYSDLAGEIDALKNNIVQRGNYKDGELLTPKQISFVDNIIRAVESDKGSMNMFNLYMNSFLRLASGVKSVISAATLTTSVGFLATNFWGNGGLVATFAGIKRLTSPKYLKMGRDMFKFLQQSDKYFKNGIVDASTGEIRAFLEDDFTELLKTHFKDDPKMLKSLGALSQTNLGKNIVFNNMAAIRDVSETANMWNMLVLKDHPVSRTILGAIDGIASKSSKAGNWLYEKDVARIMRIQGYMDKFAYLMVMDEYIAKYGDNAVFEFNRTFVPISQMSKTERKFASSLMMFYSFKRMNLGATLYALTNDASFSRKIKAYLMFLEASQNEEDKKLMNEKQASLYDTPFWVSSPNGVMTNMFLQNPFTESFDFIKSVDIISNISSRNGMVQALNPLNPIIKYPAYLFFNNDPEMNRIFKWDDRYSLYTKTMKESTPKTLAFIKLLPESMRQMLGIEVLKDVNTNTEFALLNPALNFAIQHSPILVADTLARGVSMMNDGKDDTDIFSYIAGKILGYNEISKDSIEKSIAYKQQNTYNEITKKKIEQRELNAYTNTFLTAAQKQAQGLELSDANKDVLEFYETNKDKFGSFSEASKYYNENYK